MVPFKAFTLMFFQGNNSVLVLIITPKTLFYIHVVPTSWCQLKRLKNNNMWQSPKHRPSTGVHMHIKLMIYDLTRSHGLMAGLSCKLGLISGITCTDLQTSAQLSPIHKKQTLMDTSEAGSSPVSVTEDDSADPDWKEGRTPRYFSARVQEKKILIFIAGRKNADRL